MQPARKGDAHSCAQIPFGACRANGANDLFIRVAFGDMVEADMGDSGLLNRIQHLAKAGVGVASFAGFGLRLLVGVQKRTLVQEEAGTLIGGGRKWTGVAADGKEDLLLPFDDTLSSELGPQSIYLRLRSVTKFGFEAIYSAPDVIAEGAGRATAIGHGVGDMVGGEGTQKPFIADIVLITGAEGVPFGVSCGDMVELMEKPTEGHEGTAPFGVEYL